MKKRIVCFIACMALLIPMISVTVYADIGPKPKTVIYFNGAFFNDRSNPEQHDAPQTVITLLGHQERYGPHSAVWPGEQNPETEEIRHRAWNAFAGVSDPEGFYFWGQTFIPTVNWTYYPPEEFKIALYFPEYDSLIVSRDSYERYAFESVYYLHLEDVDYTQSGVADMVLEYGRAEPFYQIGGLVLRMVMTIAIELALAWVWKYRKRKQIRTVLCVNAVTQVGLNILLWAWYYFDGPLNAMMRLVLAELVVLTVEAMIYSKKLPEEKGLKQSNIAVGYAAAANILSCILGWILL